jgi:isoquinoline 1-oxidoreductase beta subunit
MSAHASNKAPNVPPRNAVGPDAPRDAARRRFLLAGAALGGGLLVGCSAPTPEDRLGSPDVLPAREGHIALNGWVRIGVDGSVTVAVPRTEMGQGVFTALPLLLAEELDVDWDDVRAEPAPVDRIYANQAMMLNALPAGVEEDGWMVRAGAAAFQRLGSILHLQVTGGSSSIRDAWLPLRVAGATARAMLVHEAARRWQVEPARCRTASGRVLHPDGRQSLPYAELAAEAARHAPPENVRLKDPKGFRLIGRAAPRLDLPAKVNGSAVFGVDVRVPGMVYASLIQAPVFGAQPTSFDASEALKRRGVSQVFAIPNAVVVIADNWWRAKQAREHVRVQWGTTPHDKWSSADLVRVADQALREGFGLPYASRGDAEGQIEQVAKAGGRVIEARYHAPYLAHEALEPINCTARVSDGRVEVWASTQVASLARWRAAQVAGVDTDLVTLHLPLVGGGFGRRLEVDMVVQAVQIAQQTGGRPVKMVWTREEDTRHDFYRPAAWASFKAAVDAKGRVLAWHNRVAAQPPTNMATVRLLPWASSKLPDKSQIEGAFDLPYGIEHLKVQQLQIEAPVPVGFWRSVGHSYNAFFTECFVDELAHAEGADPVGWRRARLGDQPRHRAVLDEVARRAGWGQPLPPGRARGVALQGSFGSICAQVVEASLEEGEVRVHRVTCVLDCGVVVHPDSVVAQMQGSVVFALTAALFGEVTVAEGRVQQSSFPDQPLLSLARTPRIDVHLMPSAHAPGGVGEPGVPPLAPALANALFALTGERLRSLPLRPRAQAPANALS